MTWQDPDDSYRNYIPVRVLLEALFGAATDKALHWDGQALTWEGNKIPAPVQLRKDGQVWDQVRALAGWVGLIVEKDDTARAITVRRADK